MQMALPFVNVDTSKAAARLKARSATTDRAVVDRLVGNAENGLTCHEVEQMTGMPHQTASARLWELERMGRIYKTAERRTTRGKFTARVYKRSEEADGS